MTSNEKIQSGVNTITKKRPLEEVEPAIATAKEKKQQQIGRPDNLYKQLGLNESDWYNNPHIRRAWRLAKTEALAHVQNTVSGIDLEQPFTNKFTSPIQRQKAAAAFADSLGKVGNKLGLASFLTCADR
jgi:hypothetical protein